MDEGESEIATRADALIIAALVLVKQQPDVADRVPEIVLSLLGSLLDEWEPLPLWGPH